MNRRPQPLTVLLTLLAACWSLVATPSTRGQFVVWTGAGADNNWTTPGNWLGGLPPSPGNLAAFQSSLNNSTVNLNTSPTVSGLIIASGNYYDYGNYGLRYDNFNFNASSPVTLTIGGGGITTSNVFARFSSNISINLSDAQTWDVGDDTLDPIVVNGTLTNNGNTLTKEGYGELTLNGSNNLTGTVRLSEGLLTLGNNNALGTATLVADNWGVLQGTGPLSISNAISISEELDFSTLGGAMTLSGPITVTGFAYSQVIGSNPLNITGSISLGGDYEFDLNRRSTVNVSGSISAPGAAKTVYLYGGGTLNLSGAIAANTVSSFYVDQGKLIFASAASLPSAAGIITVYGDSGYYYDYQGYVGLGVAGVPTASYLSAFNKAASGGSLGWENGVTVSDAIDLTGFNSSARLGSATTATLASTAVITPQSTVYGFGGGGGTLTVQSNLTGARSASVLSSSGQPLTLVLSGTNTLTGGITIDNSVLRFSNAGAFPATGNISLNTSSYPFNYAGRGYVGFEYTGSGIDFSNPTASGAVGARFTVPGSSTLVLGFDSPGVSSVASTIDLNGLPTGTFFGTSTALTLSGSLVPQTSNPLRLAAVKDGHLTVNSTLSGTTGMVLNLPGDDYFAYPYDFNDGYYDFYDSDYRRGFDDGVIDFSDARSTVTLNGNNSGLSGTVYLQGGRLELGHSQALGTGSVFVTGDAMLAASTGGLTISNAIDINSALGVDTTANNLTLSGAITGYGLVKQGTGTLSLNGSVVLDDYTRVAQGTLNIGGNLETYGLFVNTGATINFFGTAPQVYELFGDVGSTVNIGSENLLEVIYGGHFEGTITGSGALLKTDYGVLDLLAANSYTGGTTISGGDIVIHANGGLGANGVQLSGGGLFLGSGVTMTNVLTFSSGTIGGAGTFAPSGTSVLTIGANKTIAPGMSQDSYYYGSSTAALRLATDVVFAADGTYVWKVQDATNVLGVGWDLVRIDGALSITSDVNSPFAIEVIPGYYYYYGDLVNFNPALSYSWVIVSATGGITGFSPSNFEVDFSAFDDYFDLDSNANFYLTQQGNNIVLNFTPIPEPSTYALVGLGGILLFARLRRRLKS